MIVPVEGIDDLGQPAKAKNTFLRYVVELGYRDDETLPALGSLELLRESLDNIRLSDAVGHLTIRALCRPVAQFCGKGKKHQPVYLD